MEGLGMKRQFSNIYKNKKVLVTGHTGFKGSWLSFWLNSLGAEVAGFALSPETEPAHFSLLNLSILSVLADLKEHSKLVELINDFKPDIVFHLAAQPLVRKSYREPLETLTTNVIGTANLFEACRKAEKVKAIINITSDKCYDNKEWLWGYRETDPMGGYDPYSASKGCSELITQSWRNSFFNPDSYGKTHNTLLASVRAGNVIGGGDWGEDRLIPDIARAISKNESVTIRNPKATRPWQHVLEPLSGYLLLGQKLLEGKRDFASAWNFGPKDESAITVGEVVNEIRKRWPAFDYKLKPDKNQPHEAHLLKLDCSKAYGLLNWYPVWNSCETFAKTTDWYREFYQNEEVITEQQLTEYIESAERNNAVWLK
jgi:CDP-glucose 4,6-dehydratase